MAGELLCMYLPKVLNDFLIFFGFVLKEITPQLFARLSSHPEQVVRQQLESLLIMLSKLAPWSIVYPTLVDANTHEKEPTVELQHILACLVINSFFCLFLVCILNTSH